MKKSYPVYRKDSCISICDGSNSDFFWQQINIFRAYFICRLSSEYPAVVRSATVGNLDDPGPSLYGDSYWSPGPRELAVVDSVVKLLWIRRSIISVKAEICACRVSRLAFILSSSPCAENPTLFSSLPSVIPVSASPVLSFISVRWHFRLRSQVVRTSTSEGRKLLRKVHTIGKR